jgi:hypothetical protein
MEGGLGATKPVVDKATADGEEEPEEVPEWAMCLTICRDICCPAAPRSILVRREGHELGSVQSFPSDGERGQVVFPSSPSILHLFFL